MQAAHRGDDGPRRHRREPRRFRTLILPALALALGLAGGTGASQRLLTPELDVARACAEDADLECARREADRVFRHRPDDPTLHVFLSGLAWANHEDIDAVAPEYLPAGLAFATTPARRELIELIWREARYGSHLDENAPGEDLKAERAWLLARMDRFEPTDEIEEVWKRLLSYFILKADNERAPPMPDDLYFELLETRDSMILFTVAKSLPLGGSEQLAILDQLLESDGSNPRYSAWLIYRAAASPNAPQELARLARTGFPSPGYDDDVLDLLASFIPIGQLDERTRAGLAALIDVEPRRHDSTEHAATILARDALARGEPITAMHWLDRFETRFGPPLNDFGPLRAKILASQQRYKEAADTMLASLKKGGVNYRRWYKAARYLQLAGEELEAVRLYQYYLVQLDDRARGAQPFGPPAEASDVLEGHARVWGHLAELQPAFFSHAAARQLLEMLALTAAGLLAAARLSRARSFVLPAALAAEIAFFGGLISLRAAGGGISVISWLWLLSSAARVFVLVGGGLYLSAAAGLRRRASASLWILAAGCAAAAFAGHFAGFAAGPRYVLDEMPAIARLGELGLAPRSLGEVPALFVSALRGDAAAMLVWPALAFAALGLRVPGRRAAVALAIALAAATLFAAAGSAFQFPLALAGAAILLAARVRLGAAAPFLLHASFLLGGVLRGIG